MTTSVTATSTTTSTTSIPDPFQELIQTHQEQAAEVTSLFQILGEESWILNAGRLREKEVIIKGLKMHPLLFLYFAFPDQRATRWMVTFHDGWVLTFEQPWTTFLNEHSAVLNEHKESFSELLPGFCSALGLVPSLARAYVDREDWKGFIEWIYESRKKQFNLS